MCVWDRENREKEKKREAHSEQRVCQKHKRSKQTNERIYSVNNRIVLSCGTGHHSAGSCAGARAWAPFRTLHMNWHGCRNETKCFWLKMARHACNVPQVSHLLEWSEMRSRSLPLSLSMQNVLKTVLADFRMHRYYLFWIFTIWQCSQ